MARSTLTKAERKAKILELKRSLKGITDAGVYRSVLGKIAGMSGDRAKKAEAGKKGGDARARNFSRP